MDDLLKPSLSNDRPAVSLYSARAGFFTAFFGGPLAITFFTALNSKRLDRLKQDIYFLAIGAILLIVLLYMILTAAPGGENLIEWVAAERRSNPLFRYGSKILALVLWGGYYIVHRPYHRAMQYAGLDSPSPWKAALGCIGLSLIVELPLVFGILYWKMGFAF